VSGVFIDGGNHDAASHGGDGISHGGHSHGQHGLHGHGQGGHSFIAQILGLDQQDHAHLAHHGAEGAGGHAPSQTPAWSSALQGLKIENLFAGINITPNILMLLLFGSFIGWLGVIYFIRHHEPFANQVLGSSAAYAPTANYDRHLINNCRDALPLKTSAQMGVIYTPDPQNNQPMRRVGATAMYAQNPQVGSPGNQSLTAAMGAAMSKMAAPSTYISQPSVAQPSAAQPNMLQANSSPVNQSLSAAMSSSVGAAPSPAMPGQQAPFQSGGSARIYSARTTGMGQSMSMASPLSMGGGARIYSARSGGAPAFGNGGADSGLGMRLFSSRRAMMAQSQQAAPQAQAGAMPATTPVANPNAWSLANQGSGTFSADTAQFNSQFGAPQQ
jgi:hypothetical protein